MSDPRLNSIHLEFPRREEYRQDREALLSARGLLTLAGEYVHHALDDSEPGAFRPNQILPGTRFFLLEQRAGWTYQLKTGLNTLGRLPNNDLPFEELCISRRHCVLLLHARGGCELHDTASRNGTFVNDERVHQPVQLSSGDRIRICGRRLLFVSEADYRAACNNADHPATIAD